MTAPICARCGQPLTGRYLRALDRAWHEEHFLCEGGGEVLTGPFLERDGRPYCERHYWERFGDRCGIGGEVLRGGYLTNEWGDRFCEPHARAVPSCFSCQRPICERLTLGGVRYADGRHVCTRCRQTAVDDVQAGHRILADIRTALAREGLELGRATTPLRLVSQPDLDARSRGRTDRPAGMACLATSGVPGGVVQRRVDGIVILYGLPRVHFGATAAHELGHAYLFLHEFPDLARPVAEGLCELCAFLWLSRQDSPDGEFHLKLMWKNDDHIYGEGFRAASKARQGRSMRELLEFVRTHARLPT